MPIKLATLEHANAICRLVIEAREEFTWNAPPVKIVNTMRMLTAVLPEGYSGVMVEDNAVVGAVVLRKGAPWYSTEEIMIEVFTYVREGYNGIELLRGAVRCAQAFKLPLMLAQTSGIQVDRMVAMYKKLGFQIVGFAGVRMPP